MLAGASRLARAPLRGPSHTTSQESVGTVVACAVAPGAPLSSATVPSAVVGAAVAAGIAGLLRVRARHARRERRASRLSAAAAAGDQPEEVDVVVIGAGVGGLSCAGLLARTGRKVVVCESHTVAGGVAHAFKRGGYEFDSGPSLLSGVSSPLSPNPLRHVLNALGEDCEWVTYPGWRMVTPDGDFDFRVGDQESWEAVILGYGGSAAVEEWRRLLRLAVPLGEAAKGVPAAALRGDIGAVATMGRFLPKLPNILLNGLRFQAPFEDLIRDAEVRSPFLRHWLDYICFVLQALPATTHPTAPVAYMLSDMHTEGAVLDYPSGGMGELINALVRGVERAGGELRYGAHVEEILLGADGVAKGLALRGGRRILAREAVVSNASAWDTAKLLPAGPLGRQRLEKPPATTGSFMHLHLGLRASALPKDLPLHFSVVRDWSAPIDEAGNVVIISIPSAVNPALAPAGRHCLHAYLAATEPFAPWEGLVRGSAEYEAKKQERAQPLWDAVERALGPGMQEAAELVLVGSPLTHARFARRHRGTYGPLMPASAGMLPGPRTPVERLLCCGDSTFPGIGLPAAAASGCSAAAALMSVPEHLAILDAMDLP